MRLEMCQKSLVQPSITFITETQQEKDKNKGNLSGSKDNLGNLND